MPLLLLALVMAVLATSGLNVWRTDVATGEVQRLSGLTLPNTMAPGDVARDRLRIPGPRGREVRLQHRQVGDAWQTIALGVTSQRRQAALRLGLKADPRGEKTMRGRLMRGSAFTIDLGNPGPQQFRVHAPAVGQHRRLTSSPATIEFAGEDPASWCVQTDTKGRCSFGPVPYITGVNSEPWVDQNVWTEDPDYTQTLYAASPREWRVIGNADTNNGGVLTFANTGWHSDPAIVAREQAVASSWSVEFPRAPERNIIAWAMYDLWFNDWADEVSIIVDLSVNDAYDCEHIDSAEFGGMPWHLCVFGYQRVLKPGADDDSLMPMAHGELDITEMIIWLEDRGHLPRDSTWTAGSFGYEICDTGGVDVEFRVNDFTWVAE